MSTAPKDDEPTALTTPARVAPRKLALRVSGARVGSTARPAPSGEAAAAPVRGFGLRVHSSGLAPRPAATTSLDGDPYSVDDYERR